MLAIFGLLVASLGTVGYKGYRMGENACIAEHAKLLSVELRTRDAAMAAAEAIRSSRCTIPSSGRKRRRSPVKSLCTAIVAILLTGCASSIKPSPTPKNPLLVASCPPLTPLTDDSFGATTLKLVEVAGLYHRCREAALALEVKR
jgi:hypothetical protein